MRSTLRWDWGDVLAGGRIVTGETRELELEAATLLIGQQGRLRERNQVFVCADLDHGGPRSSARIVTASHWSRRA